MLHPMETLHGTPARFEGGLREVAEGLHAWLQPNGTWGESNAALVAGKGESLLVDTLWTPALARRMLAAMEPVTAEAPIRRVVNTHADGDHTWGNQEVAEREIISTRRTEEEMTALTPGGIEGFRKLGRALALAGRAPLPYPGRDTLRALGPFVVSMIRPFDFSEVELTHPTRTFEGTLELDVGGRSVELIEVGPAHTAGDLIVHVPDARAVIAADVAFVGVTPVMWAGPAERWVAALDRIEALEPEVVIPGHGPPCGLTEIRELREYWVWLEAAARRRLAGGLSFGEAAADILAGDEFASKPWSEWENPERTAINVHTIDRHRRGEDPELGTPGRLRVFAATARLQR